MSNVPRCGLPILLLLLVASHEAMPSSAPLVATGGPMAGPSASAERRGISVLPHVAADAKAIDRQASLAVTDRAIVREFSFREVMERLACEGGVRCAMGSIEAKQAALRLFRAWWATQRISPPERPCHRSLFGFPYCDRLEGEERTRDQDPFGTNEHGYSAIGLFNRIDLADPAGRDCGEYRIVFARNSGFAVGSQRRLLINFEAVLPNPAPQTGLAGCYRVAEHWAGLANINPPQRRVPKLRQFYFDGIEKFPPAVHVAHYGMRDCPPEYRHCTGQVRTNQFMGSPWMLREFRLARPCLTCGVDVTPSRVAQTPYGPLFGEPSTTLANTFQDHLLKALPGLLWSSDVNTFHYDVPEVFTSGQSESCRPDEPECHRQPVEGNYLVGASQALKDRLKEALRSAGYGPDTFAAEHVIQRAQALSCAGCHELSRAELIGDPCGPCGRRRVFPESLGFVHVSEQPSGTDRYLISPALEIFLEHRASKLAAVLKLGP